MPTAHESHPVIAADRLARRIAFSIDPKNHLDMVILVERFDMSGEEQKTMYGGFMKAAVSKFGASSK